MKKVTWLAAVLTLESILGVAPAPAGRAAAPAPVPAESSELAAQLKAGKLGFQRLVVIQRQVLNPTHVYTYHQEGFQAGGGLFVYDLAEGKLHRLVDAGSGQIIDCDPSYDGRTLLFSWRKAGNDVYQVYSLAIDPATALAAGEPKALTQGKDYNYNACWLPDGGIAFLSTRKSQFAYCWTSPVGILHRMNPDGTNQRKISANYLNDFTPSVTNDGRIIYGRWEYVDRPAIPIQSLWTINPDGTALRVYYGNRVLSPATFIEPRAVPGSGAILCTMTAHNGPCRGAVGLIDPIHGDNAQESIRNLTPEIDIGQVDKGDGNHVHGPYESPYPLGGELYLVSKAGTILLRDFHCARQVTVLPGEGRLGFYGAQPLAARPRPPVVPSTLPENAEPFATVLLQNVDQGLGGAAAPGEIKQIAVVQEIEKGALADVSKRAFGFQFPVVSCGATYAPKKVWGYADVAPDGSAAFKVPAGVPIYFIALDANGMAVQRMRSFTHMMSGEVQGCIGCHEPRTSTSPALGHPSALRRLPQSLAPPQWGVHGFGYSRIVQPVLDKFCVRCHNAADAPKGLDLSGDMTDYFNVSYEMLARQGEPGQNPYTSWIPTYNGQEANILRIAPRSWGSPVSKLAQVVSAGHPDKDGVKRLNDMDDASKRRIYAWIDLNVPYYATSLSNYYELQGCRRMYPDGLDAAIQDVAGRRCVSCHKADGNGNVQLPQTEWIRIGHPERNGFLAAPLARKDGGTGKCGQAVFESTNDPDYRKILKTFEPIAEQLRKKPRMDMIDLKDIPEVCSEKK